MDDEAKRWERYTALYAEIARDPSSPGLIEAGKRLAEARREWLREYEAKAHEGVGATDPGDGNHQGHDLAGRTCWCNPDVQQLCPSCRADDVVKLACARCGGEGWVAEFTEDPGWPTVTVHRDATKAMLN